VYFKQGITSERSLRVLGSEFNCLAFVIWFFGFFDFFECERLHWETKLIGFDMALPKAKGRCTFVCVFWGS